MAESVPVPAVTDGAPDNNALLVDHVSMEFAGKRVLHEVDFAFPAGTVSGLIGHNGSGKSTLVRILAGYYRPVSGACWLAGERIDSAPQTARRLGLRFVHQDLGLVREFTPLENFGIGGEYAHGRFSTIDWKHQKRRLADVFALLDSPVPADRPVSELTAVERSLVAISRAIGARPDGEDAAFAARFIVLDEPTTTLEATEAEQLFAVIRRMCESGIGALFISHHLSDVLNLCSTVGVLRDGYLIGNFDTTKSTRESLVEAMLGADTVHAERRSAELVESLHARAEARSPIMTVEGLRAPSLQGIDIRLHPGETVAVVGLAGSGREEIVYALSGANVSQFDRLTVGDKVLTRMSPAIAREHGIALAPGNRLPGSIVNDFVMRENLTFVSLETGPLGFISRRAEAAKAEKWVERFDIKPDDVEFGSRYMSGGNKQKMIIGKWLSISPKAMLIDEPTAGVDVGAVAMLFETLRSYVVDGGALLISTSELGDATALADRVIVLIEGRIHAELVRGTDEISEQTLLLAMVQGASGDTEAAMRVVGE
jgi:ribose transport system ATP-binding protein